MQADLATIWHNPCFTTINRASRMRFGSKIFGRPEECHSTKRGYTMPAFTFEKISPPAKRTAVAPVANKKQRGVIVQVLNRLAEARVKRSLKQEARASARNAPAD